jgi:ribosomal protein L29
MSQGCAGVKKTHKFSLLRKKIARFLTLDKKKTFSYTKSISVSNF